MSQINPLTGYVIGSVLAQNRTAAEKERQLRRVRNLGRNSALQGDQLELTVESAEAINETNDQGRRRPDQQPEHHTPDSEDDEENPPSHLDLTA